MKKIEVKITEKDKGTKDLSLLNLRDEVVNFLYKDTVANSTKTDMQFFVLLFFASIQVEQKTFLEKILEDGVPKFKKLNAVFSNRKGYLHAGEYKKMVDEHGLTELFKNDIFFVIIEAVLNIDEIKSRFSELFEKHKKLGDSIISIGEKYSRDLEESFKDFQTSRIQDDRYDEHGNYHDLSKSVYRTVRMRNSRNLDLNLQRYTSIKKITSESPVDLTFLQHIDPQIIFDLWDKYQVAEYMKSMWSTANNSPIIANTVGGIFGGLVVLYAQWKLIDGRKNRTEKKKAKQKFEKSKTENGHILDDLTLRLVDSVLKANERLEKEVEVNRTKVRELSSENLLIQDKDKIKKLEERIAQLENLSVQAKVIDYK
ncbi:hypothetical protein A2442_01360 [Candidatus Campbellbacteria bacterium RIFOXYC2_FULL_35_25]|uniref:Uncharacterized protein n=1 Tax=Candidatus Campbellbacteria bacterium RIFOXYC2_FULL_35_25 TaxID=1797582 RepID=A0A1F5EH94_9BACT|nr:MAG: hypothetical protein A2442_01360 [Candidatus Campbellbacteria bacterium RIFOXYC2_FULL_35_25]